MATKSSVKSTPAAKTASAKKPSAKPAAKPASKSAAPAAKPATTAAKPAAPVKPKKAAKAQTKPAKPKLVRDSFTIPKDEYLALADLKARMTKLMQPAKKSELLRAGLKVLAVMSDAVIKKALASVPAIKTGRPAKAGKK